MGKENGICRIARPGTRLAGALRKLEEALARDHRGFARQAREFGRRFRRYSPMNRALIGLQRPEASFVMGRGQWAAQGRVVRKGARAIHVVAPVLKRGEVSPPNRYTQVRVYDVSDTEGDAFVVPVLVSDVHGPDALVDRRLSELEMWVRRSGLELRYGFPAVNQLVDGATDGMTIWIRPDLRRAERLRVIAHEIAHVKLHFRRKQRGNRLWVDDTGGRSTIDVKELEAELMAFLLLSFSGIDCSGGSASYLSTWNAGMKAIREHTVKAFSGACSVLRNCETGRFGLLVDEPAKTIPLRLWTDASKMAKL